MARKSLIRVGVGEQLLSSKLQVLNGAVGRQPSLALGILTGRVPEPSPEQFDSGSVRASGPLLRLLPPPRVQPSRRYLRRSVHLAARHLADLDAIIDTWQAAGTKRLSRSAVVRRAIEHLRASVETSSASS